MAYILKEMTHQELVSEMEKAALVQTGVPLKFQFELSSDGNLDLYRVDKEAIVSDVLEKMADSRWIEKEDVEVIRQEEVDPFDYYEDSLGQTHMLFQFVLERTFGEEAKIAGTQELEDCVLLNVAIPV